MSLSGSVSGTLTGVFTLDQRRKDIRKETAAGIKMLAWTKMLCSVWPAPIPACNGLPFTNMPRSPSKCKPNTDREVPISSRMQCAACSSSPMRRSGPRFLYAERPDPAAASKRQVGMTNNVTQKDKRAARIGIVEQHIRFENEHDLEAS